jgi:hypothetical protein
MVAVRAAEALLEGLLQSRFQVSCSVLTLLRLRP